MPRTFFSRFLFNYLFDVHLVDLGGHPSRLASWLLLAGSSPTFLFIFHFILCSITSPHFSSSLSLHCRCTRIHIHSFLVFSFHVSFLTSGSSLSSIMFIFFIIVNVHVFLSDFFLPVKLVESFFSPFFRSSPFLQTYVRYHFPFSTPVTRYITLLQRNIFSLTLAIHLPYMSQA